MHSLMSPSRAVSARDLRVLGGGFVITAVTVAVLRQVPGVSHTTVALALLLIVLGTASIGKLWTATVVAHGCDASVQLFLPPSGRHLHDRGSANWIALLAFLAAAVIASHLSSSAQARAREAIERRNEVTRLFDLTRDVLVTTDTSGAMDALARHVARRFELSHIAICLPVEGGWHLYQGSAEQVRVATDVLDDALVRARGVSSLIRIGRRAAATRASWATQASWSSCRCVLALTLWGYWQRRRHWTSAH